MRISWLPDPACLVLDQPHADCKDLLRIAAQAFAHRNFHWEGILWNICMISPSHLCIHAVKSSVSLNLNWENNTLFLFLKKVVGWKNKKKNPQPSFLNYTPLHIDCAMRECGVFLSLCGCLFFKYFGVLVQLLRKSPYFLIRFPTVVGQYLISLIFFVLSLPQIYPRMFVLTREASALLQY